MTESLPLATLFILAITIMISISGFQKYRVIELFRHYPYEESRHRSFYRWLSCTFVHGSPIHLFLNAFVLYQFGFTIERVYDVKYGTLNGSLIFLVAYIFLAILSCIPTYIKHRNNSSYASIGASGVISGILFIYILYFPLSKLYIFFMIPLPSFAFGILYLFYSQWAAKNTHDGIDHEAHYWGAVAGIILGILIDPQVANNFISNFW